MLTLDYLRARRGEIVRGRAEALARVHATTGALALIDQLIAEAEKNEAAQARPKDELAERRQAQGQ